MRWSWLRAALLGVLIGPTPVAAEPPDLEDPSSPPTVGHGVGGRHFHVWDEDRAEAVHWARELGRLAGSAELERWRGIAERSAAGPGLSSDQIEVELSGLADPSALPGEISPLGCMLCLLPSLDRTTLICSWATSPREATRLALARALSAPFQAIGADGVVEHLERDPEARVRELARAARATRRALFG